MLKVIPRKDRTIWETIDGRIRFGRRIDSRWGISIGSSEHQGDYRRLADFAIRDLEASFETRSEAIFAVVQAFQDHPSPPTLKLRQAPAYYEVEDWPIGIFPAPHGKWDIGPLDRYVLNRKMPGLAYSYKFECLCDQEFKTRKEALETLEKFLLHWLPVHLKEEYFKEESQKVSV